MKKASIKLRERFLSKEKKILDMSIYDFNIDCAMGLDSDFAQTLRHDYWSVEDGLLILMGLEPSHILLDIEVLKSRRMDAVKCIESIGYFEHSARIGRVRLTEKEFDSYDSIGKDYKAWKTGDTVGDVWTPPADTDEIDDVFYRAGEQIELYFELWQRQEHEEQNPPKYYVQWAINKNLPIPWLATAKKIGFFSDIEIPTTWISATCNVLPNKSIEKLFNNKERSGLLNIIGALLELLKSPRPGRDTNSDVINELLENYPEKNGISKSNLENKFADAKRSLGN
jgi:hypothetical protein